MAVKPKTYTGDDVVALRKKLNLNQSEFWSPLGVTQSGGSRYESGRKIPRPVQKLLAIAYGTEKQAELTVSRDRIPRGFAEAVEHAYKTINE